MEATHLKPFLVAMEYNELIELFFERSNALQTFWTIYITVVGALLAFCATRERLGLWTMGILTVGFGLFAAANLDAMHDVTIQRLAAEEAIRKYPVPKDDEKRRALDSVRKTIEDSLTPPKYGGLKGVRTFHLTCDVLTLSALWTISYRRNKSAQKHT